MKLASTTKRVSTSQALTIKAVDLMLGRERRQVGNEKEIEEELDIGGLFVMLELGILEQGLITRVNGRLVWMIALLWLSLVCIRIAGNWPWDVTCQWTLPKRDAAVAHLDSHTRTPSPQRPTTTERINKIQVSISWKEI